MLTRDKLNELYDLIYEYYEDLPYVEETEKEIEACETLMESISKDLSISKKWNIDGNKLEK